MMVDNRTLRANARMVLENKLLGTVWLKAALISLIYSAVIYLAAKLFANASFGSLLLAAVTGPLSYGVAYIFLNHSRHGSDINIRELFIGFTDDLGESLLLGILTNLFISLWSILLVVPGILKALSWSQVWFIRQDNPQYSWRDCQKASAEMMRGHRGQYFMLMLSYLGWFVLGSLLAGVGILWVAAYWNAGKTEFYRALTEGMEEPVYDYDGYDAEPDGNAFMPDIPEGAPSLPPEPVVESAPEVIAETGPVINAGSHTGEYRENGNTVYGEFSAVPSAPAMPDQRDFDEQIIDVADIPNHTPSLTLNHSFASEEKTGYVPELTLSGNDKVLGKEDNE